MNNSLESVMTKLLVQQNEAAARQQGLIESLAEILQSTNLANTSQHVTNVGQEQLMEILSKSINEFRHDPEADLYFSNWYSRHEVLFLEDAKTLDDASKVRLILRKLNQQVYDRYADFILPKKPQDLTFSETITTLTAIFDRQESLFNVRYNCLKNVKDENEDFITYAGRVNKLCERFQCNRMSTQQFKCLIFIIGLQSTSYMEVRRQLISMLDTNNEISLEKLTSEVQRMLTLKNDAGMVEEQKPKVNAVSYAKHKAQQGEVHVPSKNDGPSRPCWQCGSMHYVKDCNYTRHKCKDCGKVGHKEGFCNCFRKHNTPKCDKNSHASFKHKRNERQNQNKSKLHTNVVAVTPTQSHIVKTIHNHTQRRKFITITIDNKQLKLQLDTAADVTIISKSNWIFIGRPKLQTCTHTAADASNNVIPIIGEFVTEVQHNDKIQIATIYVTGLENLNVFGTDLIDKFDYWNENLNFICNAISTKEQKQLIFNEIKQQFPGVLQDKTGHCTKFKLTLQVKPDSVPVFKPKRPVPYATVKLVEAELDRLQTEGIITPITHSAWAAPIVVVRKSNNKIRICGDYSTGLNHCMEPNLYPLPHADEIFAKMANCKYFSKIDLSDAYLQFEVDDASKQLLSINTHKGIYMFNRLPPGVTSAPGAFQKAMDTILAGLSGVFAYLDDVIIASPTIKQNSDMVKEVIKRFQEHGLTIRWEKCEILKSSIQYLGHIVDSKGIQPDPSKVESIRNMPRPNTVSELRSFLGAINYYGKFINSMRDIRHPLDNLLKNEAKWEWTNECEAAFQKFKKLLQSDLLLTHYDSKLPIYVAADASIVGIGAQIFHEMPDGTRKAIYHVSRALTSAEQKYSQIEKEALALVYGCTKFHRMIYGRNFTLQTDHKPLLSIFGSKKGIPTHTANRLQRWALVLMSYNFTIEYVNTKEFGNVDVLSRLISNQQKDDEFVVAVVQAEADIQFVLQDNIKHMPITQNMVRAATMKDPTLKKVMEFIQNEWPNSKQMIPTNVEPFYNCKESLYVIDSCIMSGERVVIPTVFQNRILKQLHKGHQGIERMKSLARSYAYWPRIDKDISDYVKKCNNCAMAAKSPVKSVLSSWPTPEEVLDRIHIDIAGPLRGKYYFIMVDAYSKWPEAVQVPSISSNEIVKQVHAFISRYGQPKVIVSDNGTQFTSSNFRKFCEERGIQHMCTPPYHPQSNGQAERFVDTIKRALEKSYCDEFPEDDVNLLNFLSQYRATPNTNTPNGKSPSEYFMGRRLQIPLDLLKPSPPTVQKRNQAMEDAYNKKHGAKRRSFKAGDKVYAMVYKNNKMSWNPGEIIERVGEVTYNVLVSSHRGHTLIRSHINQLRDRISEEIVASHPLEVSEPLEAANVDNPEISDNEIELPTTSSQSLNEADTPIATRLEEREEPVEDSRPRRSTRNHRAPRRYSPS